MIFSEYIEKRAHIFDKNIEYFENKINANYFCKKNGISVPEIYHICKNITELKNINIPDNCVIKFNNLSGSKGIIFRKNKKFSVGNNIDDVINFLEKNKTQNPKCQISIKKIPQKIIIEELLYDSDNKNSLIDIKLFCINGKIEFIFIVDPSNRSITYSYDINYKRLKYELRDADKNINFKKPKYLDEIIKYGNKLAKNHFKNTWLRIDFYSTSKGAVFGEFTFRPGNNFYPEIDKYLGKLIK